MDEPEPGEAAAAIFLPFPSPSDVWEDLLIHGVLRNIENKKNKNKKKNSQVWLRGHCGPFLRLALLLLRSSAPAAAAVAIHYQQAAQSSDSVPAGEGGRDSGRISVTFTKR